MEKSIFCKYIKFVNREPYIFYSVEYNEGTSLYFYETKSEPLYDYMKRKNIEIFNLNGV
jgi:hypothetical protein